MQRDQTYNEVTVDNNLHSFAYSVSFANSIASASDLNCMMDTTGPKVSSYNNSNEECWNMV